jgi:hypothetical protein
VLENMQEKRNYKKNINKYSFKSYFPIVIYTFFPLIVYPFVFNDYSFKFLKTVKYWATMVPLLILIPILIMVIIEENK